MLCGLIWEIDLLRNYVDKYMIMRGREIYREKEVRRVILDVFVVFIMGVGVCYCLGFFRSRC